MTIEETKSALFHMRNLKSPGPDGFHTLFFKSQWDIVGTSIHRFVLDVFNDPSLIQDVNETLLTLIPKCEDPSRISHFRPYCSI